MVLLETLVEAVHNICFYFVLLGIWDVTQDEANPFGVGESAGVEDSFDLNLGNVFEQGESQSFNSGVFITNQSAFGVILRIYQ